MNFSSQYQYILKQKDIEKKVQNHLLRDLVRIKSKISKLKYKKCMADKMDSWWLNLQSAKVNMVKQG